MSEFLTINISDHEFSFRTRKQLETWWANEGQKWSWAWASAPPIAEFRNLAQIGKAVGAKIEAKDEAGNIRAAIENFYATNPVHAAYSGCEEGERYLRINELAGPSAAARFMLMEQSPNHRAHLLQNASILADYVKGAAAAFVGPSTDKGTLAQERRNYRDAVEKLEQRVRDLEGENNQFVADRYEEIGDWRRKFVGRFREGLKEAKAEFEASRDAALQSIAETENQYRTQMALKAPVEYWQRKATSHGHWEIFWTAVMIAYFVAAAFAIYGIANMASRYLLAVPDAEHATPIYIIVSGATIGAMTLIFWLGRLITKLFLSEHHLRSECREKAVMTEAFLAMETRETFSSEERAIILASVFRSSPDGIVRDDGPAEFGFQAMLARAVNR